MRLSRRDKVVTGILLLIIALLIYLMQCHWRNRFGSHGEAKPVGEVVYKYHQVQRKLSDRMLWEDVESKSPIFAYDWVMTKDKSDARITLKNGMKVDMDPESMVEIDETQAGVGLTLKDGTIRADTRESKEGTIMTPDGTKIDLSKAAAQITADGKNVSVDVQHGNATLKNRDKEAKVAAGEIGNVTASGLSKEKTGVILKSPGQGDIFTDPDKAVTLAFEAPKGSDGCSIEVAGNKSKRTLAANDGKRSEKFRDGTYTWRVRCKLKGEPISSPTGVFRMRPQSDFALVAPAPGEQITANRAEGLVLKWRSSGSVHADVATAADFANPVKSADVDGQSLAVPNLKPGKYYWRVYPQGQKSGALSSSFSVSEKGELLTQTDPEASKEIRPPQNTSKPEKVSIKAVSDAKIFIEPDVETGRVAISWTPVNKTYSYRVRVAGDAGFTEPVVNTTVAGKNRTNLQLKPGEYYYRVEVRKSKAGRALASTLPQKISVMRKKLPPPPKVKSVQAD